MAIEGVWIRRNRRNESPPKRELSFPKITKYDSQQERTQNCLNGNARMVAKHTLRVLRLTGFPTLWRCGPNRRTNAPNCAKSVHDISVGTQKYNKSTNRAQQIRKINSEFYKISANVTARVRTCNVQKNTKNAPLKQCRLPP